MTNIPTVYIIILNWNGLADTLECLNSVYQTIYPSFEVIVVDNGSTDGSADVISLQYPQATLIRNEMNLGFTGGNNIAIRHALEAGADYVWLLNNDTVVETNTLSLIVLMAESDSRIGMVSPVIYYYDEPAREQFSGSYIDWDNFQAVVVSMSDEAEYNNHKTNIALWGTALLIKKPVIEAIGFLEERCFAYYEDTDYSIRSNRHGFFNVIESKAKIYHKDSRSTGGPMMPQQVYYRGRNSYFLWMKALPLFKRMLYQRYYLANTIVSFGWLLEVNCLDAADSCLDGFWSAVHNQGGDWGQRKVMPNYLKRIFRIIFSGQYHLWSLALKGNMSEIMKILMGRLCLSRR